MGMIVYIAARNEENAKPIIESIIKKGFIAKYVHFDAYEEKTLSSMIETVYKNEGQLDVLVNNYGSGNPSKDKTIFDTNVDDYMKILELNIKSVFITCQKACEVMKDGGSIINISTIGSVIPDIARIGYCTSKATINSLTQNIAIHGSKKNIRCNAVLPGLIETKAAIENMPKEFLEDFLKNVPLNRIGKPEDISNLVSFLASDESSYITGEIIEVAGGFGKATPLYSSFIK